jgi:hypothetical protein
LTPPPSTASPYQTPSKTSQHVHAYPDVPLPPGRVPARPAGRLRPRHHCLPADAPPARALPGPLPGQDHRSVPRLPRLEGRPAPRIPPLPREIRYRAPLLTAFPGTDTAQDRWFGSARTSSHSTRPRP